MMIKLKVSLPIEVQDNPIYNQLVGSERETLKDLPPVTLVKNKLIAEEDTFNTSLLIGSDIITEYALNTSEPSITVPNDTIYRFVSKINNEFVFTKDNPKPTIDMSMGYLDDELIVATLTSWDEYYDIYELPYGGIDKTSCEFYTRSRNGSGLRELPLGNIEVDYIRGLLYVPYKDVNSYYDLIVLRCNLIPLPIRAKGSPDITAPTDFYKVFNKGPGNLIEVEYVDRSHVILRALEDVLIFANVNAENFCIDGVRIGDMPYFLSKHESVYVYMDFSDAISTNIHQQVSELSNQLSGTYNITTNTTTHERLYQNSDNQYTLSVYSHVSKNMYDFSQPQIISLF